MSEAKHQQAVIKWSQQPSIREQWPELKLLHHIKNETKEGCKQVAVDRAMGVKKGVPDLCLPVACGKYNGLYIEMKAEKGRISKEQEWWINELNRQGYAACLCYGWKAAVGCIEWYMKGGVDDDGVDL